MKSTAEWDEIRARRGIRSSFSIPHERPAHLPEKHSSDCTPGQASIEVMAMGGQGLFDVRAVCSDCGAYLDQLYLGPLDVKA